MIQWIQWMELSYLSPKALRWETGPILENNDVIDIKHSLSRINHTPSTLLNWVQKRKKKMKQKKIFFPRRHARICLPVLMKIGKVVGKYQQVYEYQIRYIFISNNTHFHLKGNTMSFFIHYLFELKPTFCVQCF